MKPLAPQPDRHPRGPRALNEVLDNELWSTIDLQLGNDVPTVNLRWFSYSPSMQVENAVRTATRADTNIPRKGDASGLPSGWHFKVRGWRARAVAPRCVLREDSWWAWCATVSVAFYVRDKSVARWPFDELLRSPRLRDGVTGPGHFDPPIEIPEACPFWVEFQPEHPYPDWDRVRELAVTADPSNAFKTPGQYTPIKLRCFLRGALTTAW